MDKLDKLTIISVLFLAVYASVLLALEYDPARSVEEKELEVAAKQHVVTPELKNKIQLAKNLLIQDNLTKSESLVESLIREYPYEGTLYILKGDILMRYQKPIAAMYEYKEAISLNPDFLDKKTNDFQGKKIKVTVEEAMSAIESGLQQNPSNGQLKDHRQTVYFMKRKLAGSCG